MWARETIEIKKAEAAQDGVCPFFVVWVRRWKGSRGGRERGARGLRRRRTSRAGNPKDSLKQRREAPGDSLTSRKAVTARGGAGAALTG